MREQSTDTYACMSLACGREETSQTPQPRAVKGAALLSASRCTQRQRQTCGGQELGGQGALCSRMGVERSTLWGGSFDYVDSLDATGGPDFYLNGALLPTTAGPHEKTGAES